MEEVLNFIAEWGLPHFLIGLVIINVIGILKLCKVFSKIQSSAVKKFLYYALDVVLSFWVVACYYALWHIDFTNYIVYAIEQLGLVTTIYAIYENFHIRDVWKKVLNWVGSWFKYNPDGAVTKLAKKIGFDEAIIKLQEEKQKEEAEKLAKEQEKQKVENKSIEQNARQ